MKKAKIILIVGLLLITVITTVSCQKEKALEKKDAVQVGFAVVDISMGYWSEQIEGAQAKADELGIELIVYNSDADPSREINVMENWISQGVDAIIISAVDPQALAPYVKQAREKGIPVIAAIHDLKEYDAFVDQDEYMLGVMTGELAGQWIAENLEPDSEFAVLGFDGLEHVIIRGDGMVDGVINIAPEATLVARQDCNGRTDLGMQVAESMMQAYPNLRVFVAVNDACAIGVYEAIKASGKSLDDFCVVGSDGSKEAFEKIAENSILRGTIDLNPFGAGQLEVQYAYDLINNKDVAKTTTAPMQTITYENLPEEYK